MANYPPLLMSLEITRRDARHAALRRLVDYAGLFPPAGLDMTEAVAGYRSARGSEQSWMVDRFICPAGRLEELVAVLAPSMTAGEEPFRIAVTCSPGWLDSLTADAGAVRTFIDTVSAAASVDVVEVRVPDAVAGSERDLGSDGAQFLRAFPAVLFFEMSSGVAPDGAMDTLVELRRESARTLGVKLRCGGSSAELFPSPDEVARFICAAAARRLPLKATAGLHHPYRHSDPNTGFRHHGFVNVLAASALAYRGESEATVAAVLADEDPTGFVLDRSGLSWRGSVVDAADLAGARRDLFVGYGSCSFDEPVEDLTALGILPVGALA